MATVTWWISLTFLCVVSVNAVLCPQSSQRQWDGSFHFYVYWKHTFSNILQPGYRQQH